MYNMLIITK